MSPIPRVFLGHLSRSARHDDIKKLFEEFENIKEIALKDGYGFVEFNTFDDAQTCVREYHGRNFMGDRLVVELAKGTRRERGSGGADRRRELYEISWLLKKVLKIGIFVSFSLPLCLSVSLCLSLPLSFPSFFFLFFSLF